MVRIKLNLIVEVAIRILLYTLFAWINQATDPFMRQIRPEEIWLYSYPVKDSYVTSNDLWITIIFFPVLFLATEYFIGKTNEDNKDDISNATLAITLGYSLNGFLTAITKTFIGRPRPCFFYRCFPDGSGSDFTKCTGDQYSVNDGRKSFPSGHTSFAFTCMVFMSLYIRRKLDLRSPAAGGQGWKLLACILPILVATLIGISRTCDYHHHYEDVIAGSILGTAVACVSYWMYFCNKQPQL